MKLTNDLFKKKATFVQNVKVEMISTSQWNEHLRKVPANKTLRMCKSKKKKNRCRCDIPLTFHPV